MNNVFRIIFFNDDKQYELYAKDILQSDIFGFIEIEQIIFGEQSSVLVDPGEEKLKLEFANVTRSYIPMHNIIRIDEVPKQGVSKILNTSKSSNVAHFPNKD